LRAAGDGDAGAVAGEEFSDPAVDAAGAADDDNGLAGKIGRVMHRVASQWKRSNVTMSGGATDSGQPSRPFGWADINLHQEMVQVIGPAVSVHQHVRPYRYNRGAARVQIRSFASRTLSPLYLQLRYTGR